MFVDLVIANFDVVGAAITRKDPQRTVRLCRSCLVNKLPPLLSLVVASAPDPVASEQCTAQALQRIGSQVPPTSSLTSNPAQHNSILHSIRQEFLYACALHRLLPASSVPTMLGASPPQVIHPPVHYNKDDLVQQIRTNHSRIDVLIAEMNMMQGNTEPIVHAVIEACYLLSSLILTDID